MIIDSTVNRLIVYHGRIHSSLCPVLKIKCLCKESISLILYNLVLLRGAIQHSRISDRFRVSFFPPLRFERAASYIKHSIITWMDRSDVSAHEMEGRGLMHRTILLFARGQWTDNVPVLFQEVQVWVHKVKKKNWNGKMKMKNSFSERRWDRRDTFEGRTRRSTTNSGTLKSLRTVGEQWATRS